MKFDVPGRASRDRLPKLSPRETQVLAGVADGLANCEIAAKLGISTRTVETHRERVRLKLNVKGTAQLVKWAIKFGVSSAEPAAE